jgi:hypothetical protein
VIDLALLHQKAVTFSGSEAEYNSIRHCKLGDEMVVEMYMNNGGVDLPDYFTAENVKITTSIITSNGKHKIRAVFSGDNIEKKTGEVTLESEAGTRLEAIANSGNVITYDGHPISDQKNSEFANTTYVLGLLNPGFDFSLFFTFKVRVVKEV